MKGKIPRILSVALALVLVLSFSLVVAAPVAATVSEPAVTLTAANAKVSVSGNYSIVFTTTVDLVSGDTISIVFPTDTDLTGYAAGHVTVNPDSIAVASSAVHGQRVDIVLGANRGKTEVTVAFDADAVVENPSTVGSYTLQVYTSKETTAKTSADYVISQEVTNQLNTLTVVALPDDDAGATTAYTLTVNAGNDDADLAAGDTLTFEFPAAADVSGTITATFDALAATVSVSGQEVTVIIPTGKTLNLSAGKDVVISGVVNPTIASTTLYKIKGKSNVETVWKESSAYTVSAGDGCFLKLTAPESFDFAPGVATTFTVVATDEYWNPTATGDPTIRFTTSTETGTWDGDPVIRQELMSSGVVNVNYIESTIGTHTITIKAVPQTTYTNTITQEIVVNPQVALLHDGAEVANFNTIQEAIAAAVRGDTVQVGAGTYTTGDVVIDKGVTLISDTGDYATTGTIITGASTFYPMADDITIKGFKFQVTGANVIKTTSPHDSHASDVTISYNSFTDSTGGCLMDLGGPTDRNGWLITRNYIDGVIGVNETGLMGDAMWIGATADGWEISYNIIKNCDFSAIHLCGACKNVIVTQNNIDTTRGPGIQVTYDDGQTPPDNITITNNTITNAFTEDDLFDFLPGEDKPGYEGLPKGAITLSPGVTNITIEDNNLTANHNGVSVFVRASQGIASSVNVNYNNISGTTGYGVTNAALSGTLDAESNWWGDETGPYQATTNSAATGDPVSDNVDFSPWLDAAYPDGNPIALKAITLYSGWNLISLPLIPTNSDIETVLAGADVTVNKAAYYTGGPAGDWLNYILLEPGASDLTTMNDGKGYWIDVSAGGNLTATGVELALPGYAPPTYDVVVGWNLIGFTSTAVKTVDVYLGSVLATVEAMYKYDAATGLYTAVVTENDLASGQGYWLAVNAAGKIYP